MLSVSVCVYVCVCACMCVCVCVCVYVCMYTLSHVNKINRFEPLQHFDRCVCLKEDLS